MTLDALSFFGGGEPSQAAPRTWFVPAFANVTAFETDDGLLLVDAGLRVVGPAIFASIRARTSAPLHTVVFTHGHVDHAFGLDAWLSELAPARPRIIGHRNVRARFERYAKMGALNARINAVQFGLEHVPWPTEFFWPDTVYDDSMSVTLGGEVFELRHSRGESDDATWLWAPGRKVLCTGDFWIGCAPNAGNPQKVQRYAEEWELTLRTMAGLGAEVMLPGHGSPILGAASIRSSLLDAADYLRAIIDTTIEGMERGLDHDSIVERVRIPEALAAKPYLQPAYDRPEFVARNVIRLHGGWWNGHAADLLPALPSVRAKEIAALAGGVAALVARARTLELTDMPLACHLAEWATLADPADRGANEVMRDLFTKRAEHEPSLMARNIFRAAAKRATAALAEVIRGDERQ